MIYNFDEVINRRGTHSMKWDAGEMLKTFGLTERFDDESIPLFVADMDFACPEPVLEALRKRVDQRMFGYSLHSASPDYHEAIQGWFRRRHGWAIASESIVYSPGTVEALEDELATSARARKVGDREKAVLVAVCLDGDRVATEASLSELKELARP